MQPTDPKPDGEVPPPQEGRRIRIQIEFDPHHGRLNLHHPNDLFLVMQLLADSQKAIAQKAAQAQAEQHRIQIATPGSLRAIPRA